MNKLTVVGVPLSLLGFNLGLFSPAVAQENSLLVIDNLTTLSPDAETFTPDNPINRTLVQIEQYNLQNQENLALEPLTKVSDLRDIKPTDWSYRALEKLINRYRSS